MLLNAIKKSRAFSTSMRHGARRSLSTETVIPIQHNFNAGPGTLPRSVMERARKFFMDHDGLGIGVIEMSHRSKEFQAIAR